MGGWLPIYQPLLFSWVSLVQLNMLGKGNGIVWRSNMPYLIIFVVLDSYMNAVVFLVYCINCYNVTKL